MMVLFEWPILYQMIADVEHYRYERCGFLFGLAKDEHEIITRIMPVPNIRRADKRVTFEISSTAYMHAEARAEQTETKLLGVYHSHPNHPAIPSLFDWAAAQPNVIYTIISVRKGKISGLRLWQLNTHNLFEEKSFDFIASSDKTSSSLKLKSCGSE